MNNTAALNFSTAENVASFVLPCVEHFLDGFVALDDCDDRGVTACELARQAARDFVASGNKRDGQIAIENLDVAARYFYGACTAEYARFAALLGV